MTKEIVAAYSQYEGQGFENATPADFSIPFIQIIQALSPEARNGVKQGSIYNRVTCEEIDGQVGVLFCPAITRHVYCEWVPRTQGGGFVAHHDPNSKQVRNAIAASTTFGKYTLNGNDLVETYYVYGICINKEGSTLESAISFTSTKTKQYRLWMTLARSSTLQVSARKTIQAPLFAYLYRLTTALEQNKKGTYYNWRIKQEKLVDTQSDVFIMALSVRDLFSAGALAQAHEQLAAENEYVIQS
jgi:hypothetical protein